MNTTKINRDIRCTVLLPIDFHEIAHPRDSKMAAAQFHWHDRCPSWQRYGDGSATFTAEGHTEAGWLQITAQENGEKASKKVYLCFDRAQVVRLRDLCNLVLGD